MGWQQVELVLAAAQQACLPCCSPAHAAPRALHPSSMAGMESSAQGSASRSKQQGKRRRSPGGGAAAHVGHLLPINDRRVAVDVGGRLCQLLDGEGPQSLVLLAVVLLQCGKGEVTVYYGAWCSVGPGCDAVAAAAGALAQWSKTCCRLVASWLVSHPGAAGSACTTALAGHKACKAGADRWPAASRCAQQRAHWMVVSSHRDELSRNNRDTTVRRGTACTNSPLTATSELARATGASVDASAVHNDYVMSISVRRTAIRPFGARLFSSSWRVQSRGSWCAI